MNKLFKTGQYVLLEDCEAYDKKYGLLEGSTKNTVAEKLNGEGVLNMIFMDVTSNEVCVGIIDEEVGVWHINFEHELFERLSVEDVLYASGEGLTLDELRGIPCAFDEGKEYDCVEASGTFTLGRVSAHKGSGLRTRHGTVASTGYRAKFEPVTKPEVWIPSVGEEVMYTTTEHQVGKPIIEFGRWYRGKIIAYYDGFVWTSDNGLRMLSKTKFKPIDKERDQATSEAESAWRVANNGVSGSDAREVIAALYDAGMLKSIK